jgi:hypothetical protein
MGVPVSEEFDFFDPGGRSAEPILRCVINYPIFVPPLPITVTEPLLAGDVATLCSELQRLSDSGSWSAGALLAYLHLRGAPNGAPDLDSAERACSAGARSRHAYSEYVFGWIQMARGQPSDAVNWLRRSAKQLFPPALVDIARFMANGIGFDAQNQGAAIAVLRDAHRLGHRMALVYIAEILRGRSLGWRLLGNSLYWYAVWRATRFASRYPFSPKSFVTSLSTARPLFRS